MAIQRGIPVTRITLFVFGGIAQIADEPDRPVTEFLIAIMGPLMSIALAVIFGALWLWLRIVDEINPFPISLAPLILLASILFQVNGSLALFNLAPGFPLDGGRVLRAILWGTSRDLRRATWWATRAGQTLALLLIAWGGWVFYSESNGSAVWYVFIGLFLWNAAGEGYRQTLLLERLRRVSVGELMVRTFATVPPDLSIAEFVEQHVMLRRDQTFAVSEVGGFHGIISIDHIKRLRHAEWTTRRVRDVMTPVTSLQLLTPQQTAAAALARLTSSGAAELPVVEAGQLIGFLGRADVSRFLQLKSGQPRV